MALADSCAKPNNRVRRQARLVTPGSAPAIAFALLPSVVGAEHATDGIALTATVTALCVMAAVLIQPLARRLDAHANSNRAATMGLLVLAAGLAVGAATAHDRHAWLLVPCAIVLGSAYGLCLVAGLVEIQRLADHRALAGVTAAYHELAYLGFAAPYLIVLAANLASYSTLLVIAAALALSTTALVARGLAREDVKGMTLHRNFHDLNETLFPGAGVRLR